MSITHYSLLKHPKPYYNLFCAVVKKDCLKALFSAEGTLSAVPYGSGAGGWAEGGREREREREY